MIDNLKMAISDNNIQKARRILIDELIDKNYPSEIFNDALELAESYNVFQEHSNEKFLPENEALTKEYLEELKRDLDENFSKERFIRTYYVARKLDKSNNFNNENNYNVSIYDHYRDFFFLAQVGTAVITVAAIGIGALLYKIHKKK